MTLPVGNTNRFLDLVQNREAISSGQFLSVLSAAILAYADNVLHFGTDPILTLLGVYAVTSFVTMAWARFQVWSKSSVISVATKAASTGVADINATQEPDVK